MYDNTTANKVSVTNSTTQAVQNTRLLRDAFSCYATGVVIVTTAPTSTIDATNCPIIGITVNSFSSVSLTPALVAWSLESASNRYCHFAYAKQYVIHVLSAKQEAMAKRIAKNMDNFLPHEWLYNEHGVPIIDGCLAVFECVQRHRYKGGDHEILLGEVIRYHVNAKASNALGFYGGEFIPIAPITR